MNDGTSGTHADTEATEAERRPNAATVDGNEPEKNFDIDPDAELIRNVDESVERAAW